MSLFCVRLNHCCSDLPTDSTNDQKGQCWACEGAVGPNPSVLLISICSTGGVSSGKVDAPLRLIFSIAFWQPYFLLCLPPLVCVDVIRTTSVTLKLAHLSFCAAFGISCVKIPRVNMKFRREWCFAQLQSSLTLMSVNIAYCHNAVRLSLEQAALSIEENPLLLFVCLFFLCVFATFTFLYYVLIHLLFLSIHSYMFGL